MGPISPASLSSSNPFSAISPKPKHHQPNANVLASSPNTFSSFLNVKPEQQRSDEEWTVEELEDDDEDERESAQTEVTKGPLVVYSRTELLKLAKKDSAPQTMPTLDSWFGPWSPSKTAATPNYGANHESDGYQRRETGLIGRGIGNSGRPRNNIGLRRNPEDSAPQAVHHEHEGNYKRRGDHRDHTQTQDNFKNPFAPSQMGRFGVGKSNLKLGGDELPKAHHDEGMKRDRAPHLAGARTRETQNERRAGPSHAQDGERRRDDTEWRRGGAVGSASQGNKQQPGNNRRQANGRWQQAHDDDALEPAWMDDEPKASEKPEALDEPLIKFVPGEDMIAAHKRAMKARAEPAAPPGLFVDPAIAATSAPPQPAPKVFNPADYLLPEKDGAGRAPEPERSVGGSSRFQRFFGGAQPEVPPAPVAPQPQAAQNQSVDRKETNPMKLDDHMAKLLGMLDPKAASPVPSSRSPMAQPPRHEPSPLPHQQQSSSYGSYDQPPGLGSVGRHQSPLPPHMYASDTGSSRFTSSSSAVSSETTHMSPPPQSRLHARMPQQDPSQQAPPQGRFMQQQQLLQQLSGSDAAFDPRTQLNSPPPAQQNAQDPMQALFAQAQRQQMLQRSVEMQQHFPSSGPPPQFNRPPPGMYGGPGPAAPDLLRDLQHQAQRGYGPGPGPGGFPPPSGHFPPQQFGYHAPPPPPPPGMGRPMFGMMPPPPLGLAGGPASGGFPQQDAMAALFAGLNHGQGQRAPTS